MKSASWKTPNDVKRRFRSDSIIGDNRVVFNIAGNKYRLIVKIHYNTGIVYLRFVGTHKHYDAVNAEEVRDGDQTNQNRAGLSTRLITD